ncbi:hypothetical protein TWF730_000217 [Orbilia blumenaviensis]|uniref:F-box domain-containing protein n=1 Tax=Orbilia blumenaviensis TaxID=1796055 RepID=A0AAV9VM00_9PEZI
MTVNHLPTEIIAEIFEQPKLKEIDRLNMLLTCKRWEQACAPLFFKELLVQYLPSVAEGINVHQWEYPVFADSTRYRHYVKDFTLYCLRSDGGTSPAWLDDFPTPRMIEILQNLTNVTKLNYVDLNTGIRWVDFWAILDTAITSMPHLSSMKITRTINSSPADVEPASTEELRRTPANLRNVSVSCAIYIDRKDVPAAIDNFFRRLFQTLGDKAGDLITSICIDTNVTHPPKGVEPESPKTWRLNNLEKLEYRGGEENYLPTSLVSADFSKVKDLQLLPADWKNLRDKWEELPPIPPVFGSAELVCLQFTEPFEKDSDEWENSLKYLPKVERFRFYTWNNPTLFPITRNKYGTAIVGNAINEEEFESNLIYDSDSD